VNPGTKTGFYVNSFDEDGNKIGESPVISLFGISTPNTLKSVTFTLDTAVVAQLSTLSVSITQLIPLD
jgi:hypothetical protein